MLQRKLYKPGEKVPRSGQAEIISSRGAMTRVERTVIKGEPFPPTPRRGQGYVIIDRPKHIMLKRNIYKPGEKVPRSGQAEIISSRGARTGVERIVIKGEPFPPTPRRGQGYVVIDKTKHRKK